MPYSREKTQVILGRPFLTHTRQIGWMDIGAVLRLFFGGGVARSTHSAQKFYAPQRSYCAGSM